MIYFLNLTLKSMNWKLLELRKLGVANIQSTESFNNFQSTVANQH